MYINQRFSGSLLVFLGSLLIGVSSFAQGYDISNLSLGGDLEQWYQSVADQEGTDLIDGVFYVERRSAVKSNPYLRNLTWTRGTVNYRGETFRKAELVYNLEDDVLLMRHPNVFKYENQPIELNQDQIDWFELGGGLFRNFKEVESAGFYEVLFENDEFSTVAKRRKIVVIDSKNISEYIPEDKYYFYFHGEMQRVQSHGAYWRVIKKPKKEVKAFMKENQIPSFKNSTDQQRAQLAEFCSTLTSMP